jgi:hypothetical protein
MAAICGAWRTLRVTTALSILEIDVLDAEQEDRNEMAGRSSGSARGALPPASSPPADATNAWLAGDDALFRDDLALPVSEHDEDVAGVSAIVGMPDHWVVASVISHFAIKPSGVASMMRRPVRQGIWL